MTSGIIRGYGTLSGSFVVSGGTIKPGSPSGAFGAFTINGSLQMGEDAVLAVTLRADGTCSGLQGGSVTVAGRLDVDNQSFLVDWDDYSVAFLNCNSLVGDFDFFSYWADSWMVDGDFYYLVPTKDLPNGTYNLVVEGID